MTFSCTKAVTATAAEADRRWTDPGPVDADTVTRMVRAFQDPGSLMMRASTNPVAAYNRPEVLAGGWPASGLVTTSRALARFYRDLVGGAVLARESLREAVREHVRGPDSVLLLESAFGLGDIDNQLAIAFVANLRRDWLAGDRRAYDLVAATYSAL